MYRSSIFTMLLVLLLNLTSVLAAEPETTVPPPDNYYLRSQVYGMHQDCGTKKNDLYINSFHTGAGLGDAVLTPNRTGALQGYFNDTQQVFTYQGEYFARLAVVQSEGSYQSLSTVTASSVGSGVANYGFFFNDTGLQSNASYGGWLVCDWWHETPQLFSINGYLEGIFPKTCSRVHLMPVAVEAEAGPAY